jgi:hypothetical protein
VSASYDALVEIFERIENFMSRLMIYDEIPFTRAMTEIIIKIMVELLSVLALATKQVSQGRISKPVIADNHPWLKTGDREICEEIIFRR